MLEVQGLESGYGAMQVLWGASLEVKRGSLTALLGPNGAGKSTLLRSIFGLIRPWRGRVLYGDREVSLLPPHRKVELGLILVPEGRHLFPGMSVQENLLMGAYSRRARGKVRESLELVYSLFPVLKERSRQRAGSLSGGEQQMLTIGRALMARPELMMLDEPSQGLAPKLAAEVFEAIRWMKEDMALTILLVEQSVETSLEISDYIYIMHEGQIKAEGPASEIREAQDIREAYLGI